MPCSCIPARPVTCAVSRSECPQGTSTHDYIQLRGGLVALDLELGTRIRCSVEHIFLFWIARPIYTTMAGSARSLPIRSVLACLVLCCSAGATRNMDTVDPMRGLRAYNVYYVSWVKRMHYMERYTDIPQSARLNRPHPPSFSDCGSNVPTTHACGPLFPDIDRRLGLPRKPLFR